MSPELDRTAAWEWTAQREEAAQLVADDRLSNDEIAAKVKISAKQLERWKENPEFADRVADHLRLWRAQIRRRGLAIKERRVESLIGDFEATETILRERGLQLAEEADAEASVPGYAGGARTGFITRDYKGKDADTPIFTFDAALMRERRELRKQIAQELGEWEDARRLSLALPAIRAAKDASEAVAAVLAAVAAGEISASDGQKLAAVLETQRRIIETVDIEQRLSLVEQSLNDKNQNGVRP